jgi:hypothetical protein
MARPTKPTGTATTETLTTKVTRAEKRELEALLARKNRIALMQGHGEITISFYIRSLIVRDLAAAKEQAAGAVTTLPSEMQVDSVSKSLSEPEDNEEEAAAQARNLDVTARAERRGKAGPRKGRADYMKEAMEATGGTWRRPKKPSKDEP